MTLGCSSVAVLHHLQVHISTETRLIFFVLTGIVVIFVFDILFWMPDFHDVISVMHRALLSVMLIFSKPHTNACMHCVWVHAHWTYDCNCYNVSRGTWCKECLLMWQWICVKQRRKLYYQLQCWHGRLRGQEQSFTVLYVLVCRASSVLRLHVHATSCTFCNQLTQTHVIDTSSCYCTFMPDKGWTQAALLADNIIIHV